MRRSHAPVRAAAPPRPGGAAPGRTPLPKPRTAATRSLDASPPFVAWAKEYALAQHHPAEEVRLLALGRAIGAWLDGDQGWLARLVTAPAPVILEVETSARPSGPEQAAL